MRYRSDFQEMLLRPATHLMVIGYSFGDLHINEAIKNAANKGAKIFIVDISGVDVFDKRNPRTQILEPVTEFMEALMPQIIGASRRQLKEIISSDRVENEKVMRFFEGQPHTVRIAPQQASELK
jgi:thiamine pyrophosphate-dependent acetolactate synthase large subunit-like protein